MTQIEINDTTLTFYYYNDGMSLRERQEVTNALAVDPILAERYIQLSDQLQRFADLSPATPPGDMTERWHETIKSAAMRDAPARPTLHTWSFIWGVAVTAALALGIGIGFMISGNDTGETGRVNTVVATNEPASAFVRGLQVHLRESEAELSSFSNRSTADKSELIMEIIQQNKLFEKAAVQNGDQSVARVLRAFELVLVRIAAEETTTEDAEELRAKLLFELNIMLTKLSRETSEDARTI